jgi:hypothetical protein
MDAHKTTLLKQLAQMGEVVLVTNGNRIDLNDEGKVALNTPEDAVLYFLQRLDIDMVSDILDDNRRYQNFEKSFFIEKLKVAVDEFIEAGDTYLNRYKGFCNSKSCNYKCKGYSFVGNNSNNYFDLIFDVKDGVVKDIYECINFKCDIRGINKSEHIEIDKRGMPF